jgi:flagellar motor switch protein FliN
MTAVDERANLRHLGDIQVQAVVEVGRNRIKLREARQLRRGDVIELDKLVGGAFTIRINGTPYADGEIVVVNDTMACRITHMESAPREAEEPAPADDEDPGSVPPS